MRQDRRLNGWVLIGSIIEIVLSVILLSVGVALGITGFMFTEKLAKITDLQFFINQKCIVKAHELIVRISDKFLAVEYLYLFLGIVIAIVAIIVMALAIASMNYAKNRKVVRHRVALFIFTLIPLTILGVALTYLLLEFNTLTDMIKYIAYGVCGAFGFVALCNLLGLVFGRSEKFMSNDNNKFAFNNNSVKNARAEINNNIGQQSQQHLPNGMQRSLPNGVMPNPQMRPTQPQSAQRRPMSNQMQQRPQNGQPMRTGTTPMRNPQQPMPNVQRPMQNGQPTQRPVQPMRPANGTMNRTHPQPMQARPNVTMAPNRARMATNCPVAQRTTQGVKYCKKCGKQLQPNEKICTMCGYKENN